MFYVRTRAHVGHYLHQVHACIHADYPDSNLCVYTSLSQIYAHRDATHTHTHMHVHACMSELLTDTITRVEACMYAIMMRSYDFMHLV